ncbi:MAG: PKD domain-containing protein, partial [Bacteroidales bacterium]|nr:PKD domain-containing protein [Bacteroidales bacterium]
MKNFVKFALAITVLLLVGNSVFSQKKGEKAGLDAQFLVSSYEITAGDCVYFTDMTTGNPTHWLWTFEGAQTTSSTEQHPTNICYYHPGVYSVILEVQNGAMINTEVVRECITVLPNTTTPIADFTVNYTTIPANSTVQFTSISQNGPFTSYLWEFEGGMPATSTEERPTPITYPHVGQYNVKLTVTDANGVSDVEERLLYINVVPEATISPVANFMADRTYIEPGDAINFIDRSEGSPYIWHWFFEGAVPTTSNAKNPTGIMFPMPGTYDVELVIESNRGIDTLRRADYITVAVNDPCVAIPEADFTASPRLIRSGTRVYFEDKSTNNPSAWTWEFEGGYPSTSVAANPLNGIEYNAAGFFDVFHSVSNECGVTSVLKEDYIMVFSGPVPLYCDTITNLRQNEIPTTMSAAGSWGYIGGHNGQRVKIYADKFNQYSFERVDAMIVPVAKSQAGTYNSYVTFCIWDGNSQYPDSVLAEKRIYLRNIPENFNYVVEFDEPVEIEGPFYAGFMINYNGTNSNGDGDWFAVSVAPNRSASGSNTLYVQSNDEWKTAFEKFGVRTSTGIRPVTCIVDVEDY